MQSERVYPYVVVEAKNIWNGRTVKLIRNADHGFQIDDGSGRRYGLSNSYAMHSLLAALCERAPGDERKEA